MHPNVRRAIVRGYYPGPKWTARVMAMSDEQVKTIFDLKQANLLEKAEQDEVHSERSGQ